MDQVAFLVLLVVSVNCCFGQDFATFPTNPPAIDAPTATTAPPTVPPSIRAPTNNSAEPPDSTNVTAQPVVDGSTRGKPAVNTSSFILLFAGIVVAVIIYLVLRCFRRRSVATQGNNHNSSVEEPWTPIGDANHHPYGKRQRHCSHDSHNSSRTATSSVDLMAHLHSHEWHGTPVQPQAHGQEGPINHAIHSELRPDPALPNSKLRVDHKKTSPCDSPIRSSPTRLSSAYLSAGDNLCNSSWVNEFDEDAPIRTSSMTGTMLELVQEEQ